MGTWGGSSMDTTTMLYVESVTFGDVIVPLEDNHINNNKSIFSQNTQCSGEQMLFFVNPNSNYSKN